MEGLDLSPYYMSIMASVIASLALLVGVISYLRHRNGNRPTTITETSPDEVKDRVTVIGNSRDTSTNPDVRMLRQDLESMFGVKFDKEVFTEDDVYSFFFAISNALHRFDKENRLRGGDADLMTEARGYIAILNLVLAWARANKNEGVEKRAKEILPRAEATYKRMNEL